MMNSLPVSIDAMNQTTTVHVTDPNDGEITWVVEVIFVLWDGESGDTRRAGGQHVCCYLGCRVYLTNYFAPNSCSSIKLNTISDETNMM
jgi:hypothetical protein